MKYVLYAMICLFGFSFGVQGHTPGQYDIDLQCVVDVDGLCETEYVEEVLELCKDCDIVTPEKVEVSDFEAWYRNLGIKFVYICYDRPLELAAYGAALGALGYFVVQRATRK